MPSNQAFQHFEDGLNECRLAKHSQSCTKRLSSNSSLLQVQSSHSHASKPVDNTPLLPLESNKNTAPSSRNYTSHISLPIPSTATMNSSRAPTSPYLTKDPPKQRKQCQQSTVRNPHNLRARLPPIYSYLSYRLSARLNVCASGI